MQDQASHTTPNVDSISLQLPSRISPPTNRDGTELTYSAMPLVLPQVGTYRSYQGADGSNKSSALPFPSLPSLPYMSSKEDKEARSSLRSDRSLMKAPSKGSPGSRKSKTPFDRTKSYVNKASVQTYSPPAQSSVSPENSKFFPMQLDKMASKEARYHQDHSEKAQELQHRGKQADSKETSFQIAASTYDNGKFLPFLIAQCREKIFINNCNKGS